MAELPPLPQIGQPESYYAQGIAKAGDDEHALHAWKVGQYVSLALDPQQPWEEKLRFFEHALRKHCCPPEADDELVAFYDQLTELVKQYAGREALRLASETDDLYAARLAMGQSREEIDAEAEDFFSKLVPGECPPWMNEEDYANLKLIRDQWL